MTNPFSTPDDLAEIQAAVLDWYERNARALPWRETRDPYAILVAEIMLQQTGVERVLPKYAEFLERFPTLATLAAAPRSEVIRRWAPLGYNLRAVRLHEIAIAAVRDYGGSLPRDREALLRLKGIGEYTAGALACFAFGDRRAFLDTNIRRVVGRIFLGAEPPRSSAGERAARAAAEAAVPADQVYNWHQALMDLGATICRATAPTCLICPARPWCRYASGERPEQPSRTRPPAGAFAGSSRYYRGRVVDYLRQAGPTPPDLDQIGAAVKPDYGLPDRPWLTRLVQGLERDGLIRRVAEDRPAYLLGGGPEEAGRLQAGDEKAGEVARPGERLPDDPFGS